MDPGESNGGNPSPNEGAQVPLSNLSPPPPSPSCPPPTPTPPPPPPPPSAGTAATGQVFQILEFTVTPYGPGAASDILDRVKPAYSLIPASDSAFLAISLAKDDVYRFLESLDSIYDLDRICDVDSMCDLDQPPNPTWGFVVMVTADDKDMAQLHRAAGNLARVVQRNLFDRSNYRFATEACLRFKLELVTHESLKNACDSRVREAFNRFVGERCGDPGCEYGIKGKPFGPLRYEACLVFDGATIQMLATLRFPSTIRDDAAVLHDCQVKAIDRRWVPSPGARRRLRPSADQNNGLPASTPEKSRSYAGVVKLPVTTMQRLYVFLTAYRQGSKKMEDIFEYAKGLELGPDPLEQPALQP